MTELSSGNLYQPLLVGTGHLQRLDDFMWPSYRRVQLESGGDHTAEFIISSADQAISTVQLERWFMNWAGCHFVESYGGRTVFEGYVHSLRLYVGGVMREISLDKMYNRVYARYEASGTSGVSVTAKADDTDSQAIYGIKAAMYDTGIDAPNQRDETEAVSKIRAYIQQTHAESMRDNYLDWHRVPHTTGGDIVVDSEDVVLEVYIQGYTHTVNWVYYNNGATTSSTVSARVTAQLGGLDFVTAGSIDTISTSCTVEADYIRRLDRIAALLGGEDMQWGCFAGRSFNVTARDTTSIKYRRRAYGRRRGFMQGGRYIPAPLITAGGWIFTEDIFAGVPVAADLRDDPRADWIASVEYSIDGVILLSVDRSPERFTADAAIMALALEVGDTIKTSPQWWLEREIVE